MKGREDKKDNDLFFLCSLIEYIARKTKNNKVFIVETIGKDKLTHIFELADVYHSENIDKLASDLISNYSITIGDYDNISNCIYSIPTHWDIGKVYKRLILTIEKETGGMLIDILINTINSSMYYESPQYLYESYKQGKACEE